MSAILHAITTSIENDRISYQLRNWFDMAVRFRREHKEKFSPVLRYLDRRCDLREDCERFSTERDIVRYMDDMDIEHFGEDFVEEEVEVCYGEQWDVGMEIHHIYDDEMVHAVYRVVTDDDDDEVYIYDADRSYFKVVDYRIPPSLMMGSYGGIHLWRD